MGRGDIGEVERRILAHQHDIDVATEIEPALLEHGEMAIVAAPHRNASGRRRQPAVAVGQVAGGIMPELMAARLARQHDREGRIAGDIDRFERIHLDRDLERHDILLVGRARCRWRTVSCHPIQGILDMAEHAPRRDQDDVDADVVARPGEPGREQFGGGGDAGQAALVDREVERRARRTRLDFDEGDQRAAPRDQIDLADRRAHPPCQDPPALEPQPPGGA